MLFFYLFPQYIWYEFLDLYINISNMCIFKGLVNRYNVKNVNKI